VHGRRPPPERCRYPRGPKRSARRSRAGRLVLRLRRVGRRLGGVRGCRLVADGSAGQRDALGVALAFERCSDHDVRGETRVLALVDLAAVEGVAVVLAEQLGDRRLPLAVCRREASGGGEEVVFPSVEHLDDVAAVRSGTLVDEVSDAPLREVRRERTARDEVGVGRRGSAQHHVREVGVVDDEVVLVDGVPAGVVLGLDERGVAGVVLSRRLEVREPAHAGAAGDADPDAIGAADTRERVRSWASPSGPTWTSRPPSPVNAPTVVGRSAG